MNKKNATLVFVMCFSFLLSGFSAPNWNRDKKPILKNFLNMYNPCIVKTSGEYPYKMWFFGWVTEICNPGYAGCDAIFHARSKNLKEWEVYSGNGKWDSTMDPNLWVPVIEASDKWYDNWHNEDPSVVLHRGKYYMAYSATSKPFKKTAGYFASMVCCIMGAVSEDGIHWQKSAGPLLINEMDRMNPSDMPGRIGDFHRPSLIRENSKWKMWFDYMKGRTVYMGYSENDGDFMKGEFVIEHDLDEPLLERWPNPDVVKYNGKYHCFSDAPGYKVPKKYRKNSDAENWVTRQLREAVSDDAINWKRLDYIEPDDDSPACHVPEAFIHKENGVRFLYLFYSTQRGFTNGDYYDYRYDKIRVMKRRIPNE